MKKFLLVMCLLSLFTFIAQANTKKAYLGVNIFPVSEVIKSQLSIKSGLTVMRVLPGSPAAKAGLRQYDIITKVNDKTVKGASLAIQISAFKPGDDVKLTVIRQAKMNIHKVRLGGRIVAGPAVVIIESEDKADDTDALKKKLLELSKKLPDNPGNVVEADEEIQKMLEKMAKIHGGNGHMRIQGSASSVIQSSDGTNTIRIESKAGKKSVRVSNSKTQKVIYEGPMNSQKEIEAIPQSVRQKVIDLEKSINIQFK